MGTRIGILIGFLLFSCGLLHWAIAIDTPDMPDVVLTPIPGSLVQPEGLGVRFLSHHGEWTFLPFFERAEAMMTFLISGRLKNTSGKPLTYVKLQFELLGEDKVVGVSIGGHYKAYPLKLLRERKGPIEDRVGDTAVKILYDSEADSAQVVEAKTGKALPAVVAYWFAWATFHPDTPVYSVTPQASK
jgi:hypothetical protein